MTTQLQPEIYKYIVYTRDRNYSIHKVIYRNAILNILYILLIYVQITCTHYVLHAQYCFTYYLRFGTQMSKQT